MIEPLESRIAPATLVNPTTITFQDVDGDNVTAKFSKPLFPDEATANLSLKFNAGTIDGDNSGPQQLQLIALTALAGAAGVSITVTAKPSAANGGDGFVNVGAIDGTGLDLGKVTIKGDLGRIDAGAGGGQAVKKIDVHSMGQFGTSTQMGGGDLQSDLSGALGALAIKANLKDAEINVTGGAAARLGSVIIGGSIIGISADGGTIAAEGPIGKATIGGDIRGGAAGSGQLTSGATIGIVKIGGSVTGGNGSLSGRVGAQDAIVTFILGGDLRGGSGEDSGSVAAETTGFQKITILGSIVGGTGESSGVISTPGIVGTVKIGGDLRGGGGGDGKGVNSGSIAIGGGAKTVAIGGSLIGVSTGSGSIAIGGTASVIAIRGSLVGGSADFTINSNSAASGSGFVDVAGDLASLKIGGSLFGGSGIGASVVNSGSVHIGGDLVSADIRGSLIGGNSGGGSGNIDESGSVVAEGVIHKITIGGSIVGGVEGGIGGANRDNAVVGAAEIKTIVINGNLRTTAVSSGFDPLRIRAENAIGALTIRGTVDSSLILAGFNELRTGTNADARIGKVTVGGDWIASAMAAGVNAVNGRFGDADDVAISGAGVTDDAAVFSRIAAVVIKGQVLGTPGGTDSFGFVAQHIGSFKIGAANFALTPGAGNDLAGLLVGATDDVRVREVAL